MDVYIKPKERVKLHVNQIVRMKDVADVLMSKGNPSQVEELIIRQLQAKEDKMFLISVIELIQIIQQALPEAKVINLGAADILVDYRKKPQKENKVMTFLKVAFLTIILFAGASTTIMAFHTDSEIPKVMQNYYEIFGGEVSDDKVPYIIAVPYSIGLALGIIVFFNHFSKIAMSKDPTPLEVEITTYETELNASMVDYLNRMQEKNRDA